MTSRTFTKFYFPLTYIYEATEHMTTITEQQTETESNTCTTQTLPCPSTNTLVAQLIATSLTVALMATIIVVALHIPLYMRYKRLLRSTNVSKETAANTENATYEQIDEIKFGAILNLQQNEAYATSRVTG